MYRPLLLSLFTLALTGCALTSTSSPVAEQGAAIQGRLQGGQQPISGAHVYLLAANTTGYGGNNIAASTSNASISLLTALTGHSDSIGNYVLTGADGGFSITGDYTCTAGQQVYLYALGGNPGAGTNSASGLMSILGNCPGVTFSPSTFIWINEVSTIAAAYVMAPFATDATHVSTSGTALAKQGIANAFANAASLVSPSTGTALATSPAATTGGYGTVPQTRINTLANILTACVNSTGPASTPCTTLLGNAKSTGTTGTAPSDTATAAINVAHYPAAAVATLYGIPTPTLAFAPALSAQPNDFTLSIVFAPPSVIGPGPIAIDGSGNVWTGQNSCSSCFSNLTLMSPAGAPLAAPNTSTGTNAVYKILIDQSNNAWVTIGGGVYKFSPSDVYVSQLATNSGSPYAKAIDAFGDIWGITGFNNGTGSNNGYVQNFEFTNAGARISPILNPPVYGYTGPYWGGGFAGASNEAIDPSGNVWGTSGNVISEMDSAGNELAPASGFAASAGINTPNGMVLDHSTNVWVSSRTSNSLIKMSNAGTVLSGASGFTAASLKFITDLAVDGDGNVFVGHSQATTGGGILTEFSNNGTVLSGTTGYLLGTGYVVNDLALDGSGNIWTTLNTGVSMTIGAAAPVVTPLSQAITSNLIGSRP